MSNNQLEPQLLEPQLLTVGELFKNQTIYTVPVYQRNYAWRAEQIEQLIIDIWDAMSQGQIQEYFLGNLIVTRRPSQTSEVDFEVVDGQQRLTTLYLLLTFLARDGTSPYTLHQGCLRYESRARATEALRRAGQDVAMPTGPLHDAATSEDSGIHEGFNIIEQMIRQHEKLRHPDERGKFADYLRTKVTVVRASLPPKTDLNRYFEVMNTRGQQLQHVDIVKARLMSMLPTDDERVCFAWIWDACADMDSYVQMPLARGDTKLRDALFGEDWSWLRVTSFQELLQVCTKSPTFTASGTALSLDDALQKYARTPEQSGNTEEGSERFLSPIEFPVFLLHVLKIHNRDAAEDEGHLDDKRLIQSFMANIPKGDEAQWVRNFAYTLLKCRNLFDSLILKREFVNSFENEDGAWSLQRLKKRTANGRPTPGYIQVFGSDGATDTDTRDVLLLQSMLRITYTSPRTMHWMTKVLQHAAGAADPGQISSADLVRLLKNYARSKVKAAFFGSEQPQGFGIARIVFSYLDYLLLEKQHQQDFKFRFRNSIEHFYPQHPDTEQTGAAVSGGNLHLLGNLALVSVRANSKFSNSLPKAKAENFQDTITLQSPKLQQMARTALDQGWGDEQITQHDQDMVRILQEDIQKE